MRDGYDIEGYKQKFGWTQLDRSDSKYSVGRVCDRSAERLSRLDKAGAACAAYSRRGWAEYDPHLGSGDQVVCSRLFDFLRHLPLGWIDVSGCGEFALCRLYKLYDPCHLLITCQGDVVVLGAFKKAKKG